MRRTIRIAVLAALLVLVMAPKGAAADEPAVASSLEHSQNMHPLGFSPRANTVQPFTANSDLVFRGALAFQGNYDGSGSSTSTNRTIQWNC